MGLKWYFCTLLFLVAVLCHPETDTLTHTTTTDALATAVHSRFAPGPRIPRLASKHTLDPESEDAHLLEIVLVASVNGKFHAVNRTSGRKLWSMSSLGGDIPPNLAPLVRTKHVSIDPDLTDDDDIYQELYVIEPQSGDIYVMSTPTSPLQPLSFSMSQLVEMSPLKLAGDEDDRVFVGKKETSLLSIELETGRVQAINAECPWDPFEDLNPKYDIDLDELEDYIPNNDTPRSTQVFIGRTDYHVSIYTRTNSPTGRKPPVQNLSFSMYGPNNQDNNLQANYQRTADNTYIQSLPNGKLLSFKARETDYSDPYHLQQPQVLWGLSFDSPIVAVFDVFSRSRSQDAFVLLQPHHPVSDLLQFDGISSNQLEAFHHPDTAYVGLVQETGSLFMMSNEHYPLVVFGDTEYSPNSRFLDPGPSSDSHKDFPDKVDSVTKRRKLVELCLESPFDTQCLTGKRPLDPPGPSNRRLPRVPSVDLLPGLGNGRNSVQESQQAILPPSDNDGTAIPRSSSQVVRGTKDLRSVFKLPVVTSVLAAIILGSVWVFGNMVPIDRLLLLSSEPPLRGVMHTDPSLSLTDAPLPHTLRPLAVSSENVKVPVEDPDAPLVPTTSPASRRQSVLFAEPVEVREVLDTPVGTSTELGEESEKDGDASALPRKRKAPRRRRGKRGKGSTMTTTGPADDAEKDEANESAIDGNGTENGDPPPPVSATFVVPSTPKSATPSLVVSETILGFGSHGTVVFRGSLQGRPVAVKRLLQDFVTLASREVSILQESDDHPNVIRYYYQEAHANFLYIALELCPATLADVVENPEQHHDVVVNFNPKRALGQITSGLRHLHSLKIVHRDIKPQNILISGPKQGVVGKDGGRRMLISDFGLCKKLEIDQSSFWPTAQGAQAAGTVGWRAPEILRGEVKLDESVGDDASQSSRGSVETVVGGGSSSGKTRLTKSVDIFSLGCLFYYVLTNGSHPFGDRFEREVNIIKNIKTLDGLGHYGEEGTEAIHLITKMLDPEAWNRPDTTTCLLHPYFWDPGRRLHFLQDASDRFEIMCRDPRDQNLTRLESNAFEILGPDWHSRLDKVFIENLGKFRKYDGKSVQDLLRALRNKKHHYQDLPENVKRNLGLMPEGFLSYFTRRFPRLFMHVHDVISETPLRTESMFRSYFELSE